MAFRLQSKKIYWYLVSAFILFTMTIVMLGYFFYANQKKIIKQEKRDQLNAIADLKAQQIINWRKERIGDAMVILENQSLLSGIHQWLENPSDSIRRGKILTWMTSLQKYFGYKDIDLFDTKGTLRLSIPEGNRRTCSYTQAMTGEAIRTKRIVFMDLHRSDNNDEIHLGIAIPLLVPKGDDIIPIGVLHLLIDPYQFLYPLIQSWPTPSPTAESLLVRREGEEALFLNELRHGKNTVLTLRVPISKQRMPAAIAALGGEGIVEGIDYRGIFVLAAIRRIPESPWSLIAKVDQEEIYAPIRQQVWFTGIVVGLLIAGGGLGLGLLWRHQRVEFYKSQYKFELERQALDQHFAYLTRYANDIILLENQDLKIIEANERALASYGYTRDELLQLNAWDLRSSETKPLFDATLKQVGERDGLVFETVHQRKDGTTFPVEISIRIIEVEGKKFYQAIIRDITERKRAEEALRESEERFRSVSETASDSIVSINSEGNIVFWNHEAETMFGYSPEEVADNPLVFIMPERFREAHQKGMNRVLSTGQSNIIGKSVEVIGLRKDGSEFPVEVSLGTWKTREGAFFTAIIRDITERKRAEAQLIESEERYRIAIEQSNDGVAIVRGDERLFVNKKFVQIFGYDRPEELMGKTVSMTVHPDDHERVKDLLYRREKGEPVPERYVGKGVRKDGESIYIEVSATKITYHGEPVSLVYIRDITERKKVEEEREKLIQELQKALTEVKTLSGLIPICASCKKIRDDKGYWNQIETYIRDHSEADFSHGICPDCARKLYPELYKEDIKNRKGNAR